MKKKAGELLRMFLVKPDGTRDEVFSRRLKVSER
jgi:hypothetical protein